MKMSWILGLGATGIVAFLILLALGQRKKIGELYNKWEAESKRLKDSEVDAYNQADSERKKIRKELQNESKKNVVRMFYDAFHRNPMGGGRG
jgi:Sec-independent protein translocase protein TatA